MIAELELTLSLERADAEALLAIVDRQLAVTRALEAPEGSEAWAASVRQGIALWIVKLALEASLNSARRAETAM